MAHIFPIKEELSTEVPASERKVYEALEKLNNDFYIFHSVRWLKNSRRWQATWKENDFLILNKNFGAIVLEIKGGDISYHDGVFYQKNIANGEVYKLDHERKKDPLSQAIDGVYHYRELLERIGRAEGSKASLSDRFPVEAAVWFPFCEISDKIFSFPRCYQEVREAVLDVSNFTNISKSINAIYTFYHSAGKTDVTDVEFEKILKAFGEDFDLITAPSIKKSRLENAFLRLTREQMGLLDYISEQPFATIQGAAGTGKTLVAKEAARRFAADDRKVLFLCFNKFLYMYLAKHYPCKNVTYYNIHSFIVKYGPDDLDLSIPRSRAEALESINPDFLNFDDIVIDEAQDFLNEEIVYFRTYTQLNDGRFLVFYDKNQLVQARELPEWIEKSECKLLLTKNCRNTRQIALTSYNVIDSDLNQKIQMIDGEQTQLGFTNGDSVKKVGQLLKQLTSEKIGYDYSDIVILTLKTEAKSVMRGVNRVSGIPINGQRNDTSVLFTTARKFKGLESRAVIIVDVDEDNFGSDEGKRIFYVACSRASQFLALIIDGDEEKIKRIAGMINNAKFAPKGKILMKTQAAELI